MTKTLSAAGYIELTAANRSSSSRKKAKRSFSDATNSDKNSIARSSNSGNQDPGSSTYKHNEDEAALKLSAAPLQAHQSEADELLSLREDWLRRERMRSDPEGSWAADQA